MAHETSNELYNRVWYLLMEGCAALITEKRAGLRFVIPLNCMFHSLILNRSRL